MQTENVNVKNWKSLLKPAKLDLQLSDDKSYAKIVAEPLEKGYGLTLGNSLRRILLSSIRGAAVTAIQIDGVLHEFTSIKGVREDVTDIVLNVKSLDLKGSFEGSKKLILDAKGPGEIKASDITSVPDVEILNPELVICNLDENTNFHMEMNINTGKGYVPAEENELPNAPIGTLAVDSIFNPVKKVSYNVEPVPGAKDPIEILSIELETDGSVTPEDAISYSATVLMDHLRLVEAIAKPEVLEVTEKISEEIIKIRNLLNLTIDEMELSVRSHNCLQAAGIKYIYELVSKEENQMLKYKNFGRKSLTELIAVSYTHLTLPTKA